LKWPALGQRAGWLLALTAAFGLWTVAMALDSRLGEWLMLPIGLALTAAFWRQLTAAEREQERWQRLLDGMATAVIVWDRNDRLVFANADFKRIYGLDDAQLVPGTPFEALLRERVRRGAIPQAVGREEDWIAERVAQHRRPGPPLLRQMTDGRWRRILEQPLPDGSLLSYSIDVTDLIEREQDLAQARAEAEQAHRQLRDAIEAMPAGIEIYDEADRLVVHNRHLAKMYPHVAALMTQGQPFEAMVRRSLELGQLPQARGQEEAWLAQRLAKRGHTREPLLQQLADGRWLQVYETRGSSGSIIGVRLDVSELVQQREAAATARRLLHDAIEAMPAAVEIYDADDRLTLFNARMLGLYPYFDAATLPGTPFEALVRQGLAQGLIPQALGREEAWLAERMAAHRQGHDEPRLQQAADGSWIHIYETRIGSGGIVVVRLDVSEVIRQRDAAQAARRLLDDALDALPDGFALYDAEDRLVLCNRRYKEIYRESAPAMVPGASFESMLRYGLERGQYPQAGADPQAWLAERLRLHREPGGEPILQQLHGGRWLRIHEQRTRDGGLAGARTDVTDLMLARQAAEAARTEAQAAAAALREANAALETLSTTDALTGIANRRRFDTRLHEEMQRVRRYDAPLTLLLVDIDHFKRYNDRHGHPQGDRALQAVARVLAQQARRPGELAARYGGEEFAILLPHADGEAGLAVAQRCQDELAQLALPHGDPRAGAYVTLSIGIAQWSGSAHEDAAALLKRADEALYAAKAAGRARSMLAPLQERSS
jgi:diguanylate cyclase (GGDEF)-like protein